MSTRDAYLRTLLAGCVVLQSLAPSVSTADPILGRLGRLVHEATYHGHEPATCEVGAIEELAENIDWLEHHIDKYGSVVAKQPDIWGEARLTKHRDEYERMMFTRLGDFNATINAAISQGDSAFLSQALALSNAASGAVSVPEITNKNAIAIGPATATLRDIDNPATTNFQRFGISAPPTNAAVSLEPTVYLDEMSRYLHHLHELRRINEGDDTSDSPGYALNLVRIPVSILPGKLTREGFGAEVTVTCTPVLSDDLMPTTFQNLVVNDVVDILRLPVTRVGESAEQILQEAKSTPAYKELTEQVKSKYQPVVESQNLDADPDLIATYTNAILAIKEMPSKQRKILEKEAKESNNFAVEAAIKNPEEEVLRVKEEEKVVIGEVLKLENFVQSASPTSRSREARHPVAPSEVLEVYGKAELWQISNVFRKAYFGHDNRWDGCPACLDDDKKPQECRIHLLDVQQWLDSQTAAAYEMLTEPSHVRLFASLACPGSGLAAQLRSGHIKTEQGFPDAPSVAHYRHYFFKKLHDHHTVEEHSVPLDGVEPCYLNSAFQVSDVWDPEPKATADTSVEALAWAIVVEAALLNDRLNRDVRKLAEAKEVYELQTDRDLWFFLPDTVMTPGTGLEDLQGEFQVAADMFQRYVKARWPIHVFAVDPREQDQNVADVSNRKRELQFALALGFATGKIGVNSLTQFSRELDTQVETISLNRTIVGFGHGNDTFGWRFQPRVQALDVPGTFGAIRETICGASRDYDLKHRQLEPGQRECVAVVLMPSFIPYADFDVRTNWYKLTNPKNSALTMKDTVRLSRAVTAMQNSRAQCSQCAHLYREGEVARMMKRIDQLDRELPLQSMRTMVPYENTLGGFEMFNTGVTNLAPELIGWHGAPGVDLDPTACGCYQGCQAINAECTNAETCENLNTQLGALNATLAALNTANAVTAENPLPPCNGPGTTLFLVGKNFSVHDTKVIAGGVCIPHVRLVSREIMQVTVPSCVNTIELCENGVTNQYVAMYVATPYGVTSHLHVPVTNQAPKAVVAAAQTLINAEVAKQVDKAFEARKIPPREISVAPVGSPKKLLISATPQVDGAGSISIQLSVESGNIPTIRSALTNATDPRLTGRSFKLHGVVLTEDQFRGGLIPLTRNFTASNTAVGAIGEDGVSGAAWNRANGLRDQIAGFATYEALKAANGKLSCDLVYYLEIDGEAGTERVIEEIPVEVHLRNDAPDNAKNAEVRDAAVPANVPSPLIAPEEEVPSQPEPPKQASDCNCNSRLSDWSPWTQHEPAPSPFRLAQFSTPGADQDNALEGVSEAVCANAKALAELSVGVDALSKAVSSQKETDTPPTPEPPQPIVVNVQVSPVMPPAPDCDHGCDHDHPLLGQMKTQTMECWRNVRDQLPCY